MLAWFRRLFSRRVTAVLDGRGYRVNGQWCGSQVEVRKRLENLGLAESEIIRILQDLNRQRYGDAHR